MTSKDCPETLESLQQQVTDLRAKLNACRASSEDHVNGHSASLTSAARDRHDLRSPALHHLLLLSDSALPLGAFAFSAGLESFLAHEKPAAPAQAFNHFLIMSLDSVADTTLPYVVHAYAAPTRLDELDNDLDASITCAVSRRASISQGRALLAVWERSLRASVRKAQGSSSACEPSASLDAFNKSLKLSALSQAQEQDVSSTQVVFHPNGHLPPCFGVVGAALAIPLEALLYTYLLNHAKMLLSAGIRASMLGPYQAQGLLATAWLQDHIWNLVQTELRCPRDPGDAGQCIPLIDLWGGRHEIIYSRIFNS